MFLCSERRIRAGCEMSNRLICTAKCLSCLITLEFKMAGYWVREVHSLFLSPGRLIRRQYLLHPTSAKRPSALLSSRKLCAPFMTRYICCTCPACHVFCSKLYFYTLLEMFEKKKYLSGKSSLQDLHPTDFRLPG